MQILHLSSAHNRFDTRIYIKQLLSLRKRFNKITLIVADGKGNENHEGIKILDVGNSGNRFKRFFITPLLIFIRAIKEKPHIAHLHDPELLLIIPLLKLFRIKIIFDSHEHYKSIIMERSYINKYARRLILFLYSITERVFLIPTSLIVAANPYIKENFAWHENVELITNFAKKEDLYLPIQKFKSRNEVSYVGGMSKERGILEVIQSVVDIDIPIHLNLIGFFSEKDTEILANKLAQKNPKKVTFWGRKDRNAVRNILKNSLAGIVTFHPSPSHLNAYPNKMFEYFAMGLPVICSNFPMWEEFLDYQKSGYSVDPLSSDSISNAIIRLYNNQDLAYQKGKYGQELFLQKYNWESEENKLINLYEGLMV